MTLQEAQSQVDQWIKEYGVRYFSELTNTALLMEEVGELSRHIARNYGEQSYKQALSPEEVKQKIGDEMADVLFVLICLANQIDIDLDAALVQSINKKTQRDNQRHKHNPKLRD